METLDFLARIARAADETELFEIVAEYDDTLTNPYLIARCLTYSYGEMANAARYIGEHDAANFYTAAENRVWQLRAEGSE